MTDYTERNKQVMAEHKRKLAEQDGPGLQILAVVLSSLGQIAFYIVLATALTFIPAYLVINGQ